MVFGNCRQERIDIGQFIKRLCELHLFRGLNAQNGIMRMKWIAAAIAVSCTLNISVASAAPQRWNTLTPSQQEALAPMSHQWDSLPELQQKRLLNSAKLYPKLSPEKKQRFLSRLRTWSKLTPEQRQAAREKYRAFSQVPEERRNQVRDMVKEEQAKKTQ